MKFLGPLFPVFLAIPLAASSIDVTTVTSVTLHTGDSLSFTFPTYSFAANARNLGIDPTPTTLGFGLVSALDALGGQFDATLLSRDGQTIVAFPRASTFTQGQFQGVLYKGQVAALDDSLTLSSSLARQLLAESSAVLQFTNVGDDVTLGLATYTLEQNLTVCLYGHGLSVGAPSLVVAYDDPPSDAPEPASFLLIAIGAVLLALAKVLRRIFHPIECLQPVGRSATIDLDPPLEVPQSNQRSQ